MKCTVNSRFKVTISLFIDHYCQIYHNGSWLSLSSKLNRLVKKETEIKVCFPLYHQKAWSIASINSENQIMNKVTLKPFQSTFQNKNWVTVPAQPITPALFYINPWKSNLPFFRRTKKRWTTFKLRTHIGYGVT